ncbi:MAG: Flp pilus assembly protein CpaB [Hyphomonas sp.]|uniref:Flp pilus assembly protein CpaB n=1 Tax=Hyphomonas sp. TaxID=87 RepID=UPI0035299071
MKLAPLISLGLSVLLGAGAVWMGRNYMTSGSSSAEAQAAAPAVQMAGVMVAVASIEPGEIVDGSMLKRVEWPADIVPEGALRAAGDLPPKAYARGVIVAGEPVMLEKLDLDGAAVTLAGAIKTGMRAVSIVVKNDTGVAGFVLPGDRVDVNEFIPRDRDGDRYARGNEDMRISGDLIARPVLRNVTVLAVDQTFDPHLEGARPSNTVTLEVTPEGALALGAASQRGALGLALIGREEEADLIVEAKTEPVKPAVVRPTRRAPPTARVRVINGNSDVEVTAPANAPAAPKGLTGGNR